MAPAVAGTPPETPFDVADPEGFGGVGVLAVAGWPAVGLGLDGLLCALGGGVVGMVGALCCWFWFWAPPWFQV